jgi:hypothetical protein
VLLLVACAAPAAAEVQLVPKPVEVKYHTFDPENPPAAMPALSPGEAAVCVSKFGASAELQYSQTTRHEAKGKYSAELVVDDVRVEMTLQIDVWLPQGASGKLKAHEEGHRRIAERVYAEAAERAARSAAAKVHGRRFRAEAASAQKAEAAAAAALKEPQDALIQSYLDQTSRAGQKVQEAYDEITAHGTRIEVPEADAIRQAWERHTPPMSVTPEAGPSTRPATRPTTEKGKR